MIVRVDEVCSEHTCVFMNTPRPHGTLNHLHARSRLRQCSSDCLSLADCEVRSTTATAISVDNTEGISGCLSGASWLPADKSGTLAPSSAMGNTEHISSHTRSGQNVLVCGVRVCGTQRRGLRLCGH